MQPVGHAGPYFISSIDEETVPSDLGWTEQTMTSHRSSPAGYDILFIACSFPPVSGTASRGNAETVHQLHKAGYRIVVVSADFTTYPRDESLQSLPAEVSIHRFAADDRDTLPRKIQRNLGFPPDRVSNRWRQDIERLAGKVMEQHRVPLVYSVFGNGSEHLAALRLKRRHEFHWIAEFRDPWVGNWINDEYMRGTALRPWAQWLQRRLTNSLQHIHQTADLLLVESPGHRQRIIERLGNPEKVWTNYLGTSAGIRDLAESSLFQFERRPVIGFVGKTYYGYDDLGHSFVRALKVMENQGEKFTFVSAGDNFFPEISLREGLQSHLSLGRLPYRKAIGLLAAVDLSIVMIPEAYPDNINSKIYEAIQLGTPILSLVPAGGSMAELINRHKLGTVLPLQEAQLAMALPDVLENVRQKKYCINPEAQHALAKETLMQPVLERLGQLLGHPKAGHHVI